MQNTCGNLHGREKSAGQTEQNEYDAFMKFMHLSNPLKSALPLFLAGLFASSLTASPDIFIVSRAGPTPYSSEQIDTFRDALAAELSGYGFSSSVRADRIGGDEESQIATLNEARQMGASYVLVATLGGLEAEIRQYEGHGVETENVVYELSFSYRLLKAGDGQSLVGSTGSVRRTFRETAGSRRVSSDPPAPLLQTAARVIANEINARVKPEELTSATGDDAQVNFMVQAIGMGMTLPEVVRLDDGELYVTGERTDVILDGVTVLLDGIVIGSAPGEFDTAPGLQELTLQREGYEEWKRTINAREGLRLVVRMQASEEERKRFRENATFLEELRTGRALTDAEVERVEGMAEMLRQSGYRWDIKVDTDEAIRIEQHNRTIMGDNPSLP